GAERGPRHESAGAHLYATKIRSADALPGPLHLSRVGRRPGLMDAADGPECPADVLIKMQVIRPLIIVAPAMDRSYGAGGNEAFVFQELVDYVDSSYSTDPVRESRFIGGLSMGGFIALHNAFVHTDVFSRVGGHSAYLYTKPGLNDTIENPIVTATYKDLT